MATVAARDAYRDTVRLIRLLSAIGEPSAPDRLVDHTLTVLSDVFTASVTCMGYRVGDHLQVTGACGLTEDELSRTIVWPLGGAAAQALATGRAVARHGADALGEIPPGLADLGIASAAWVPMSADSAVGALLALYRSGPEPFVLSDLQVLQPVARRLYLSVETAERRAALERLALLGHRLSSHLDPQPLLAEAVEVFRHLVGSDGAGVVQIEAGVARLVAQAGRLPERLPGRPRPAVASRAWSSRRAGRAEAGPAWSVWGGDADAPSLAVTGSRICVPIEHDGQAELLLWASRVTPRPFSADAVEVATIFANHLGAALANADLYRALAQSEARFRLITDAISDLVAEVAVDGTFRYASPSYGREVGHQPLSLLGRDVVDLAHVDDRPHLREALARAGEMPKVEYRLRTGSGGWVWVESALCPSPSTDGIVLSSRVIDERKQLEGEFWQRAMHDPLTGLANRALVREHLDRALAGGDRSQVGLLFCDLDKFKSVNDRLGHECGDQLLRQVAARLQRCVRPGDLLGRLGGDEFVLVLDGVDSLADVTGVGTRLLAALAEPMLIGDEHIQVSASVGGVVGERRKTVAATMLRDADAAMYDAKNRGRGRVAVFDDAAARRSLDRLSLESDLRHALEHGELSLHYQPIVSLDSGLVMGFEALLRWTHPERGLIPPSVVIPLAEETGTIVQIGRWVLQEACQQLAVWQRLAPGDPLTMNVNVAVGQLQDAALAADLVAVVRQAGVAPSDVWLEIAEHGYLREEVAVPLATLREAGMHLALDDFGMFYSNLSYLKRFPIESLKIDRSFVTGLTSERIDRGIVRAIMAIADSLDLDVVAEGIETPSQRHELLKLGCRRGQGYWFSHPLTASAATRLLLSDRRRAQTPSPAVQVG